MMYYHFFQDEVPAYISRSNNIINNTMNWRTRHIFISVDTWGEKQTNTQKSLKFSDNYGKGGNDCKDRGSGHLQYFP